MEPDVPETWVQRSDVSPRAHTGSMGEVFSTLHFSFLLKPNGVPRFQRQLHLPVKTPLWKRHRLQLRDIKSEGWRAADSRIWLRTLVNLIPKPST